MRAPRADYTRHRARTFYLSCRKRAEDGGLLPEKPNKKGVIRYRASKVRRRLQYMEADATPAIRLATYYEPSFVGSRPIAASIGRKPARIGSRSRGRLLPTALSRSRPGKSRGCDSVQSCEASHCASRMLLASDSAIRRRRMFEDFESSPDHLANSFSTDGRKNRCLL